jgi:hypothetical protein
VTILLAAVIQGAVHLCDMPVPDDVIFGPAEESGQYTYGHVRNLSVDEQYRALELRLETFLFTQIQHVCKTDAPFPLFLLSCVAIETMGKVFFSQEAKEGLSNEDIQREGFLRVCKSLHKVLSRPLTKQQKADYDELWGANAHKHAATPANIVYRLGRHTMVHGYRGKGVFLTGDVKELTLDAGSLIVNPMWFWEAVQQGAARLWEEFYSNKEDNNPMKLSAKLYLGDLLN